MLCNRKYDGVFEQNENWNILQLRLADLPGFTELWSLDMMGRADGLRFHTAGNEGDVQWLHAALRVSSFELCIVCLVQQVREELRIPYNQYETVLCHTFLILSILFVTRTVRSAGTRELFRENLWALSVLLGSTSRYVSHISAIFMLDRGGGELSLAAPS